MQTLDRPAALYSALKFVSGSSVLSEHRAVLIDVLLQALRDERAADERAAVEVQKDAVTGRFREWHDDEVALLQVFLKNRVARSWQEADENVMHLATKLQRDPRSVREKATDMRLDDCVDFTVAKARRQEPVR